MLMEYYFLIVCWRRGISFFQTNIIFSFLICSIDISEDQWNTLQCKSVLDAVKHVLYTKLQFHGNSDNYYDDNNSYINKVCIL